MPKDRTDIFEDPTSKIGAIDLALVAGNLLVQDMANARFSSRWPLEDLLESIDTCTDRLRRSHNALTEIIQADQIPQGDEH